MLLLQGECLGTLLLGGLFPSTVVTPVASLPKLFILRFLRRKQHSEAWAIQFVHIGDDDVAHDFLRHAERAEPGDVFLVVRSFEL